MLCLSTWFFKHWCRFFRSPESRPEHRSSFMHWASSRSNVYRLSAVSFFIQSRCFVGVSDEVMYLLFHCCVCLHAYLKNTQKLKLILYIRSMSPSTTTTDNRQRHFLKKNLSNVFKNYHRFFIVASAIDDNQVYFTSLLLGVPSLFTPDEPSHYQNKYNGIYCARLASRLYAHHFSVEGYFSYLAVQQRCLLNKNSIFSMNIVKN